MRRSLFLLALVVFMTTSGCDHPVQLTAPRSSTNLVFAVQYASLVSEPVNRVRLTAEANSRVMVSKTFDVDAAASTWDLSLEIDATVSSVVVLIELLDATTSAVIYSARTDPIHVTPGRTETVAAVKLGVGPIENATVSRVTITPRTLSVMEASTTTLAVAVVGGTNPRVFYSSLDPNIATVGSDGTVTTIIPGTARITAAAGTKADTATITVLQKLARVVLTPTSGTASSYGESLTFTANPQDPRNANYTGATVTWTSSNAAVLESNGNGKFTAKSNGSAIVTVTATANSLSVTATASVTVSQKVATVSIGPSSSTINVGGTVQLTSSSKDALGNTVNLGVTWATSDASVATVNGVGLVTGVKAGTVNITGSLQGVTSAPVQVIVQGPTSTIPNVQGTYDFSGSVTGHSNEGMSGQLVILNQNGGTASSLITVVVHDETGIVSFGQNLPGSVTITSTGRVTMTSSTSSGTFTMDGTYSNGVITASWSGTASSIPGGSRNGTLTATKK